MAVLSVFQAQNDKGTAKQNGVPGAAHSSAAAKVQQYPVGPPPSGVVAISNQQIGSPENRGTPSRSDEDIEMQRALARFTKYLVWVGVLQFVALIVQAAVFYRTLAQIGRQASIMEQHRTSFEQLAKAAADNTEAARANAAAAQGQLSLMEQGGEHTHELAQQAARQTELTQAQLELSHRPWVSVDVAPASNLIFDQRGCVLMLNVTIRNVGHSVAKHVSLWTDFVIGGVHGLNETSERLSNVMKLPVNDKSDYGWLLFPGQQVVEPRPVIAQPKDIQQGLDAGHFKAINAIGLHLVGCVDYQSSFDPTKHHQTKFVYAVARPDPQRGVAMGTFDPGKQSYEGILLLPTMHGATAD